MNDKAPTTPAGPTPPAPTRRDLMKPAQLLGLAVIAALFAGVVTLVSMGFFQRRFPGESMHALVLAGIVAGITFVVTLLVLSLLLLAVQPAQITHRVDGPVLIARDQAVADELAAKAAAEAREAKDAAAGGSATRTESAPTDGDGGRATGGGAS